MKTAALLILAVALALPSGIQAQSDMIIKQRAKDLRSANDAQENARRAADTPAPAAPAPAPNPVVAPAPATPPVTTQVDTELKNNLDKLGADLGAIKGGTGTSGELRDALEADFSTLARGSIRPSKDSLTKLAGDLAVALSAPGVNLRESGQLAQAVNVVVNSSMVSAAQTQSFLVTAQTTLKTSNVPDTAANTVLDDLKAIMDEVQKKKPKMYQ